MPPDARNAHDPPFTVDDIILEYDDVCPCGQTRRRSVRWEYDERRCVWRVAIRDVETGDALATCPV